MEFKDKTGEIIGCALEVHKTLGPGLLESVYHRALEYELENTEIQFSTEVQLPVNYKGNPLPANFRIDLFVEGRIIVEVKAVKQILPIHMAQILTYMKLASVKTGLLINFNEEKLSIKRVVL